MTHAYKLNARGYARGVGKILTLKPLTKALADVSTKGHGSYEAAKKKTTKVVVSAGRKKTG